MMEHNVRWQGLAVVILALVGFALQRDISHAQQLPQWTPQQRISGYSNETLTPILVADQNRTVHAFASQAPGETSNAVDILYSRWTVQDGWTQPIDIVIPPAGRQQARVEGAHLTQDGMMHMVFFGGNDAVAEIYYTRAPAVAADRAPMWTAVDVVGERAVTPDEAALVGDSRDSLYLLYSGNMNGNGLYATQSLDGGDTWSEPVPIFYTYDSTRWPLGLKMYVDGQDRIHAVWAVVNSTGNSEAIYYTQLEHEEAQWREPLLLSDSTEMPFETDTPNIVEYHDELMVIYHYDQPTTRWIRRSRDNGLTWSEPVKAFPSHIGSNGPVTFVIDSNDVLHVFFGERTGEHPADHGMWHSTWDGNQWRPPRAIVSDKVRDDFDPSFARAILSQGNVILVTWMTDPGKLQRGTWYSYTTLAAPELPVEALPTPPPPTATTVAIVAWPTATPTPHPRIVRSTTDTSAGQGNNAIQLMVVSIFPVLTMVFALIGVFLRRKHTLP
ncbi:MAG: exo-alpha-sialidase [Caldilineaceae bacterium]|nr:exo-alpha-sialidase [Caldilineaceae bacterium]